MLCKEKDTLFSTALSSTVYFLCSTIEIGKRWRFQRFYWVLLSYQICFVKVFFQILLPFYINGEWKNNSVPRAKENTNQKRALNRENTVPVIVVTIVFFPPPTVSSGCEKNKQTGEDFPWQKEAPAPFSQHRPDENLQGDAHFGSRRKWRIERKTTRH